MPFILNLEKTPVQLFSKNLIRIKYIQHIQLDLEKYEAAKLELKIHFLNQSYVLQLIAFWQVFIEELAEFGFRQIEASGSGGHFRDIAREKLNESLKKFNTPNKDNIDKLFKEALGVPNISKFWRSDTLTHETAISTLAELLTSRHQIAHTGRTQTPLSYATNFEKVKVLMQIAELTENALCNQLTLRSSPPPSAPAEL
ncbi:HEPN domain-containing protein [Delftia acidovorans]|uniref:HEPN domain-containing protein n=1 Tax=Delftia acidovorans TaxID=80866 RepID=A0AAJ2R2H6_DELAC|nr:HEPN domain-containing protein [Delftia acidovorans]MDX4954581.1 HEPN domain-containing protein [Delftia acidovorans]